MVSSMRWLVLHCTLGQIQSPTVGFAFGAERAAGPGFGASLLPCIMVTREDIRPAQAVRYKGVTRPTGQPYRANICLPGGFQKQIGVYGTAEEAASAYDSAARKYFVDPIVNFLDDGSLNPHRFNVQKVKKLSLEGVALMKEKGWPISTDLGGSQRAAGSASAAAPTDEGVRYRGIYFDCRANVWCPQIHLPAGPSFAGGKRYLGQYATAKEAARAHDEAARLCFVDPIVNFLDDGSLNPHRLEKRRAIARRADAWEQLERLRMARRRKRKADGAAVRGASRRQRTAWQGADSVESTSEDEEEEDDDDDEEEEEEEEEDEEEEGEEEEELMQQLRGRRQHHEQRLEEEAKEEEDWEEGGSILDDEEEEEQEQQQQPPQQQQEEQQRRRQHHQQQQGREGQQQHQKHQHLEGQQHQQQQHHLHHHHHHYHHHYHHQPPRHLPQQQGGSGGREVVDLTQDEEDDIIKLEEQQPWLPHVSRTAASSAAASSTMRGSTSSAARLPMRAGQQSEGSSSDGRPSKRANEVWVELKTAVFRKLMSVDGPALSEDEARKYRALSYMLQKPTASLRGFMEDVVLRSGFSAGVADRAAGLLADMAAKGLFDD